MCIFAGMCVPDGSFLFALLSYMMYYKKSRLFCKSWYSTQADYV